MILQYHLARITPSAAVYGHALRIPFHQQQYAVWMCRVYPFLIARMSDCLASSQSGTGMNKNADAGTSLVPE
jgi:hypothetical protein